MKHALLVATFAASAVMGVAQKPATNPIGAGHLVPMSLSASDLTPQAPAKPEERGQGILFTRAFTTDVRAQFHYCPFGVSSNDMFMYDKKSGTLNIARNKAIFTNNQISGVEIGIMRSANNGQSWTFDVLQNTSDIFFGMPVLGMVNPDGGSDPSTYPTTVYGIRYPMPTLNYGGMSMWNRTAAGTYELTLNDQPAPGVGYAVQFGDLYSDDVNGGIHWGGMLDPDGTQYGAYGYFNFNLVVEDFGQAPTMPSAWALDKWRASEQLASSYNAPMLLGGDANGTIYAAFNNFSADNSSARQVFVSQSTDQGRTWSSLNAMPANLLDAFAVANGGDIGFQPSLTPYDGGDFLVLGPDEYSFFFRVATGIRSTTDPNAIDSLVAFHVVEAAYKNGTWTLNEVGELQSINWSMVNLQDSIATAIGAPAIVLDENGRGHEVQAAVTADGNSIVVKWADINPNRLNEFPGVRTFTGPTNGLYTEGDPLTQMFDTDLFLTSRARTSNTWAAVQNLTDDADMAYRTYMPKVVPSVDNVPILRILGTGTGTVTSLLPKSVAQVVYNGGSSIDFATTSVVSVEDEKNYAFRFSGIAPNPVTGSAQVTFTLDKPATVAVEIYDMLGGRIRAFAPEMMSSGIHGATINAADLSAGTYNVALVVDGVRIMKPFVVVR